MFHVWMFHQLNAVMGVYTKPVRSVIKLLSNPRIPNNALAYGSGHYYGILGLLNNLTSLRALTITYTCSTCDCFIQSAVMMIGVLLVCGTVNS